jgi:hypothetical protein
MSQFELAERLERLAILRAQRTMALGLNAVAADAQLVSGVGMLCGWSMTNSAAAAHQMSLWDQAVTTGQILAGPTIGIALSDEMWLSQHGPVFLASLWVHPNGCTLTGAVWVKMWPGAESLV